MTTGSPIRILSIVQGSGGGIGRVEYLLGATLSALAQRGVVHAETITKHDASQEWMPMVRTVTAHGRGGLSRVALARWFAMRPDIVLFGHVNLSVLSLLMRPRGKTRFVTAVYGVDVWGRLSTARKLALQRMDSIWAISNYTANKVVKMHGVPRERVRLMPLSLSPSLDLGAVDNGEFSRPSGRQSILTVARLDDSERYKGVDSVIQALPTVALSMPNVEYVIVGEGSDRDRLERLARQLNLNDRVSFLGKISDQRLRHLYRECDVFAMPSRKEGFGLVFIEAMAAGKPVVAARAGGTPEIVADGETGLLVPYGDITAVARALTTILGDDQLRVRMGQAGSQRVAQRYQFEHFSGRVRELIGELL